MTDIPDYIRLALTGSTSGEVRWCREGEAIPAGTPHACEGQLGWGLYPEGVEAGFKSSNVYLVAVPAREPLPTTPCAIRATLDDGRELDLLGPLPFDSVWAGLERNYGELLIASWKPLGTREDFIPADMVLVPRSLVERAKAWDAAAIYCHHINDARSILGDLAAVDLPETGE